MAARAKLFGHSGPLAQYASPRSVSADVKLVLFGTTFYWSVISVIWLPKEAPGTFRGLDDGETQSI